jgi:pre-mRNA-processing factor 40
MNSLQWQEHTHEDGRKFYYNILTKESTWEKPDALKTAEELQCDWTEYFNKEGKPYYYNSKTKKSQWEKPKEYVEMMERKKELMEKNEAPITLSQPAKSTILTPLEEIDQRLREMEEKKKITSLEIEKLPKEEVEKLFKEMLRKSGVTSTWKWEDCERVLHGEEVWKAVKTFSEKRGLFNDYIRECKNKEREELRLKKDKLRVKFRQMLEEEETLTSETKFSKVIMKFCHDERWRGIDEREREELYQDYIDDLEKREAEEKRIQADTKMKIFRKMLEDKKITTTTRWRDIVLNFKDDALFASMDKYDKLRTFMDFIVELELRDKEEKAKTKSYMEFRNRENFRELLIDRVNRGEISTETKWIDFVKKIKDEAEYYNLIGQEGSTPRELFEDLIIKLKENYKKNKEILKRILKENEIKFTADLTFEIFDSRLLSFDDYLNIKEDMKLTLYNHLVKKLKEKEKQSIKNEKKAMSKIQEFIRKRIHDEVSEIISKIRTRSKYKSITNDKIIEIYESIKNCKFNINALFIAESGSGNNCYEAENKENERNETSSESGQVKKRKSKRKKNKRRRRESEESLSSDESESINEEVNRGKHRVSSNNVETYHMNNNQSSKTKRDGKIAYSHNYEKEDGETSD